MVILLLKNVVNLDWVVILLDNTVEVVLSGDSLSTWLVVENNFES